MNEQEELQQNNMISNLPLLFANGYPTSLEKMTESQLEKFIPFMVQCSLGHINLQGKIECSEPEWWPESLHFSIPFTKPRKYMMFVNKTTQNLQHHLFRRENEFYPNGKRSAPRFSGDSHSAFYKSIVPNLSVQNVDKPLVFLREFTPNGKLMIAISNDQSALEVFQYQGVGRALNLLDKQQQEFITSADESHVSLNIRQQIFNRLFKKLYSLRFVEYDASRTPARIHREFSLFFQDGQYVLLATWRNIAPQTASNLDRLVQCPDLWIETDRLNYTFFLVNLKNGIITDKLHYSDDLINLARNRNVSVWGTTMAILCSTRQCIDLYEFETSGKLIPLYSLGLLESNVISSEISFPFKLPFSPLKQNILAYIYRKIMNIEDQQECEEELKRFYRNFPHLERMIIAKMQLLDSNHLLMRYERRPGQSGEEENSIVGILFPLYVVYDTTLQIVIKIFPRNSMDLLYVLRKFSDDLRNVRSLQTQKSSSSPSNNCLCRAAFDFATSDFDETSQLNSTLPIPLPVSPYLDYSLFTYSEFDISAFRRPALYCQSPICFRDAMTYEMKFRLYLGSLGETERNPNIRIMPQELVGFVFHPYDPFIISIQKYHGSFVTNFHIYNGN